MKKLTQFLAMLVFTFGVIQAQNSFRFTDNLVQVGTENAAQLNLPAKKTAAYIDIYRDTEAKLDAIEAMNISLAMKKKKNQQTLNEGEARIRALLTGPQYAEHQKLVNADIKVARAEIKGDIDNFVENELNLTDVQEAQVKIVVAEYKVKLANIKGTPEQIKVQKNILALDALKKLDRILSEEQGKKLLNFLQQ